MVSPEVRSVLGDRLYILYIAQLRVAGQPTPRQGVAIR